MEESLLAWFREHGRDLPWRHTRDPYAILVSEVMAQQTQLERVLPRWERWMERWPTVESLAAAPAADVIREWQGLGYNRRALAIHEAARQVAAHGWPDDLTELPGVGRYTADAVACFAFERPVLPVDVNVRRVSERTRYEFSPAAAQALMDLGKGVCLARVPRCGICPLASACPSRGMRFTAARKQGPYEGSFRQRRAEALRAVLAGEQPNDGEAVAALERDGLVPRAGRGRRATIGAVIADIVTLLIPVWILLGLVVLLLLLGLLARIQQGRFIRPLIMLLMKVPLFKRWIERGSKAAMERTNPELASAMRKLEPHQKHLHDPVRAQKAMSQLTKQERAALLAMQDQQGTVPEEATNRQMRRALEKQRKRGG